MLPQQHRGPGMLAALPVSIGYRQPVRGAACADGINSAVLRRAKGRGCDAADVRAAFILGVVVSRRDGEYVCELLMFVLLRGR